MKNEDTVSGTYGSGGGNYLKAADLEGQDWEMVITGYEKKELDQTDFETGEKYKQWKVILSFAGDDRKLICNATNARTIAAAYGDGYSGWIGKTIVLFEGDWKGKPCLRVRTLKAVKKVATKPKHDDLNPPPFDDEVAF